MSIKVSEEDIVIHVISQMYELDWFSEEMTKWENINNNDKTLRFQKFFEEAYTARKYSNKAKGRTMHDGINNMEPQHRGHGGTGKTGSKRAQ